MSTHIFYIFSSFVIEKSANWPSYLFTAELFWNTQTLSG